MTAPARCLSVLVALLLAGWSAPATAQAAFPVKPIRIVIPYVPGGAVDIIVRIYAPYVGEMLGQQIVVENKPGGGTNIAGELVARSPPDGYTLFTASFASHSVNRWLFTKMPYDPGKDMTSVAMLALTSMFLCVKPGSEFKTAADIAAWGRANPGKLTFGSSGNGSPNHISGELLKHLGKFDAVHVPYKGSGELQPDLLAGQIDFAFDGAVIQHHRSGKLKCIGVGGASPWPTDPEIPPVGVSLGGGFDLRPYFALTAPAGTPAEVVEKLNAAFVAAARRPDLIEKLKVTSAIPVPWSVKETHEFLSAELVKWEALIKATGAKVD